MSGSCCSFLKVIGNAGDVDRVCAIVASEIEPQGEKQVRGMVAVGLLDVDLHPGKESDLDYATNSVTRSTLLASSLVIL